MTQVTETVVERFLREEGCTLNDYFNQCLDLVAAVIDDLRDREDPLPAEVIELRPPNGDHVLPLCRGPFEWKFHVVIRYGDQIIDPWYGAYASLGNYMSAVYRQPVIVAYSTLRWEGQQRENETCTTS